MGRVRGLMGDELGVSAERICVLELGMDGDEKVGAEKNRKENFRGSGVRKEKRERKPGGKRRRV